MELNALHFVLINAIQWVFDNFPDLCPKSGSWSINSKTSETNAAVSASQIQNLTVSATNLAPGSAASVTKSPITGGYNFAFGIPEGASGVYVGTGDMPANCNVQIDPSGDADGIYTKGEVDSLVDPLSTSISELTEQVSAITSTLTTEDTTWGVA